VKVRPARLGITAFGRYTTRIFGSNVCSPPYATKHLDMVCITSQSGGHFCGRLPIPAKDDLRTSTRMRASSCPLLYLRKLFDHHQATATTRKSSLVTVHQSRRELPGAHLLPHPCVSNATDHTFARSPKPTTLSLCMITKPLPRAS
jgi:hypothetical protein